MTGEPLGFFQVISRRHHLIDGCLDVAVQSGVRSVDLGGQYRQAVRMFPPARRRFTGLSLISEGHGAPPIHVGNRNRITSASPPISPACSRTHCNRPGRVRQKIGLPSIRPARIGRSIECRAHTRRRASGVQGGNDGAVIVVFSAHNRPETVVQSISGLAGIAGPVRLARFALRAYEFVSTVGFLRLGSWGNRNSKAAGFALGGLSLFSVGVDL